MNNDEEILFGMWLSERHTDDMGLFAPTDFINADIFNYLRKGMNLLQIGKATHRTAELAGWTQYNAETLYRQQLAVTLNRKIHHEISNMEDLNKIKEHIDKMQKTTTDIVTEYANPAKEFINEMERRARAEIVKWSKMPNLQRLTGGIKRGELTALAARPSVGKSAFGLQMAIGVAEQKFKVLYFPLEMTAIQTYSRLVVSKGFMSNEEIRTGKYQDQGIYGLAVDYIDNLYKKKTFKIYEGCNQLEQIERLIQDEKPYLVVIDQLSQLKADQRFNSFREQFSYMTSSLKAFAIRYNVAIMLLCQINRGADNTEPTMANLKESGSIEEDSDNVILLHNLQADEVSNPESIDWKNERPMILNLAKQRDGEIGKTVMYFKPSKFSFYEKDYKYGNDKD